MSAARITFLIDGFNVYHSVCDALDKNPGTKLKWLDYTALCQRLITDVIHLHGGTLIKVYYFTALARHRGSDVVLRHNDFIRALKSKGVEVIEGNFKRKYPRCGHCHKKYASHEEKESDVNIALQLMRSFMSDECDTAILMTGDTDLVTAVKSVKQLFPLKKVGIAFPFNRHNGHYDAVAHFTFKLTVNSYKNNQFPDPLILPDGTSIAKPISW